MNIYLNNTHLTPEERYSLITKNLQEVIGTEQLQQKMKDNELLKIYWGTSPTGKPHVGYLLPLIKIAHFLKANCHVTILFADLHACLDSMKTSWELLELRTKYYEIIIKKVLELLDVDVKYLRFVKGTEFQLSEKYSLDVYKLLSKITVNTAQKAGSEVVKQNENPLISSLVYPILQTLDEEYLDVDAEFGGVDQRKIFMLSQKTMPYLGYKKRIHLMNPMIPSFNAKEIGKMSSSSPASKIDLLDSVETIRNKINKAFCEEGNIENNPLLVFCKYIIFPIMELRETTLKMNGAVEFSNYEVLENFFKNNLVHPKELKQIICEFLIDFLEPLRNMFEDSSELKELIQRAYS